MKLFFSFLLITFGTAGIVTSSAFAQSTVQGDVKGVDGRAAQCAQVRLERQDKKVQPIVVSTDFKGRFLANNVPEGLYKLIATVAGGVQSPAQLIRARANQPAMVSFDLRGPSNTANLHGKKKKKFVWMPEQTGSHIGGHYVEVDEDAPTAPSALNLQKGSGDAVRQYQDRTNIKEGGGRKMTDSAG